MKIAISGKGGVGKTSILAWRSYRKKAVPALFAQRKAKAAPRLCSRTPAWFRRAFGAPSLGRENGSLTRQGVSP